MTVFDILDKLESDNSRLFKEALLKENKDNDLLRRVFVAAGDPYTMFYVSKFTKRDPSPGSAVVSGDGALAYIFPVLESLSSRKATGNEARSTVEGMYASCDPQAQKWFERILLKNLRCGVSETTVNKIWPDAIQKFGVALAESIDSKVVDGKLQINEPIVYPVVVEPKLDGLRCIAIKEGGVVTLYTRNGTLLETLPTIKRVLEAHALDNIVLDGESLGADWSESASVIMSRKKAKDDSNIVYHVFDVVPLSKWRDRSSTTSFSDRRQFLEGVFIRGTSAKCIRITDKIIANNDEDILTFYQKCLSQGYEGVMVKDPGAKYVWKRSSSILKLKPVWTHEGVIVGWHKGSTGGKRQDSFGGFEILLPNGVSTRVGSGLDDAMRAQVEMDGPDSYVGRIAECECQEVTSDGKMRFPVFVRFRDASDVDPKVIAAYDTYRGV